MRHIARKGHATDKGNMTAQECIEVVEYVIGLAAELGCRLDLRWIEHGFANYLTQAEGGGAVDWRDMVKFHLTESVMHFDYERPQVVGTSRITLLGARPKSPTSSR